MNMNKSLMMLIIVGTALAGCSKDENMYADKPVDLLYTAAKEKLDADEFDAAAEVFDEVDRQHPYSDWATKSQLMKGYAYYKSQKYPKALGAIETFIQLHPGHEDAAYAHYMRAMCYYEQIFHVLRDQKMAEQAARSMEEVFTRFPESEYARDAKMKYELVLDHMAGKEMTVGRHYLKKDAYAAAANRFRTVVDFYRGTSHVPEALHRLVECYTAMGLDREAVETAAVLGHNFASSPWYADTYYLVKGVDKRHKDASYLNLVDKLMGVTPEE
jgi:outer membrane protein assembly factor BamD